MKEIKQPTKGAIIFAPDYEDKQTPVDHYKNLALMTRSDSTRIRKALQGNSNFTIDKMEEIAEASGKRCVLILVNDTDDLNATLTTNATKGKVAWTVQPNTSPMMIFKLLCDKLRASVENTTIDELITLYLGLHFALTFKGMREEAMKLLSRFKQETYNLLKTKWHQ